MHSERRSSRLTLRIIWISCSFSSCVPWEKFKRATSTPACTSFRKTGSVFEAGPRVATIFARRCDGSADKFSSNAIRETPVSGLAREGAHYGVQSDSVYMGGRGGDAAAI